ncbi:LysR family transcriptional regulator [Bowmanella sp. Y26]|uniref:LysR family transcriptional regulator n=1 Tax=Bowmanella yangjiangensis TaxID=2811230 RepID=UPI001BDBFF90|nr:LysR family transcriptional regulator [Bowmanella yangjiangensis]MBT1061986.1 LysR family transcriptional regulator [Bowmanella yangjiangensis]
MRATPDKLFLMKVFTVAVRQGSFTKAAFEMASTVSSISKAISKLERAVGHQLIKRTTRTLELTDIGARYFDFAARLLEDVSEFEESMQRVGDEPFGTIKILAPGAIGQLIIAPKLPELMKTYPQLNIQLTLSEQRYDTFDEQFDIQITSVRPPANARAYCRQLAARRRVIVGAPEFFEKYAKPDQPLALETLPLLRYQGQQVSDTWEFQQGEQRTVIHPGRYFVSNSYPVVLQAALSGVGLANLYEYLVREYVKNGDLLTCLDDWTQETRFVYAIYTHKREASHKIRLILDFLDKVF